MAITTETGAADDDDGGDDDDDDGDDDEHENMGAMGYADDWWSTVAADDDVEDEIVDKSVQANMARGSSKSTSGMILQPLRVENGGAETSWFIQHGEFGAEIVYRLQAALSRSAVPGESRGLDSHKKR